MSCFFSLSHPVVQCGIYKYEKEKVIERTDMEINSNKCKARQADGKFAELSVDGDDDA